MTASQIMTDSMVDETRTAVKSTISTDLSDDDHQENSRTNGHTDIQYVLILSNTKIITKSVFHLKYIFIIS